MSLILDALARAERDKRREAQPLSSLLADSEHPPGGASAWGGRLKSSVILLPLTLVIIAVAAWLWMRTPAAVDATGGEAAERPVATTVTSRGERSGIDAPADAPLPAASRADVPPVPSEPVVGARSEAVFAGPSSPAAVPLQRPARRADSAATRSRRTEVVSLYADAASDAESIARSDGGTRAAGPTAAPGEAAQRGVPSGDGIDATDEAAAEETVDLQTLLREVRRESAARGLSPHPVPLLATLSKQFRDSVPTLMYLRHDYNPESTSTVLINGETLRVGAGTRGVEVQEILADSVICRYEGTAFRLRALNSWVNL